MISLISSTQKSYNCIKDSKAVQDLIAEGDRVLEEEHNFYVKLGSKMFMSALTSRRIKPKQVHDLYKYKNLATCIIATGKKGNRRSQITIRMGKYDFQIVVFFMLYKPWLYIVEALPLHKPCAVSSYSNYLASVP